MPVIYRCSNCGKPIYVFLRAGQTYFGCPTPSELVARFGPQCPYCGKQIKTEIDPKDIKIYVR